MTTVFAYGALLYHKNVNRNPHVACQRKCYLVEVIIAENEIYIYVLYNDLVLYLNVQKYSK